MPRAVGVSRSVARDSFECCGPSLTISLTLGLRLVKLWPADHSMLGKAFYPPSNGWWESAGVRHGMGEEGLTPQHFFGTMFSL